MHDDSGVSAGGSVLVRNGLSPIGSDRSPHPEEISRLDAVRAQYLELAFKGWPMQQHGIAANAFSLFEGARHDERHLEQRLAEEKDSLKRGHADVQGVLTREADKKISKAFQREQGALAILRSLEAAMNGPPLMGGILLAEREQTLLSDPEFQVTPVKRLIYESRDIASAYSAHKHSLPMRSPQLLLGVTIVLAGIALILLVQLAQMFGVPALFIASIGPLAMGIYIVAARSSGKRILDHWYRAKTETTAVITEVSRQFVSSIEHEKAHLSEAALVAHQRDLSAHDARAKKDIAALSHRHASRMRDLFASMSKYVDDVGGQYRQWEADYAAAINDCETITYSLGNSDGRGKEGPLRSFVMTGQKHLPASQMLSDEFVRSMTVAAQKGGCIMNVGQKTVHPQSGPHFFQLIHGKPLLICRRGGSLSHIAESVCSILLRCLSQIPAGKVRFTLVDPVGQGQNVAALLRLADHDERLLTTRAWTDREQIRHRLKDLTAHIENVIQKYLRAEYPTIEEYNHAAGEIAEPYRILVVHDFPQQFDDECSSELRRIMQNGPRCGVFTVIVTSLDIANVKGSVLQDIIAGSTVYFAQANGEWVEREPVVSGEISPERLPPDPVVRTLIDKIGSAAKSADKTEVPFEKIMSLAAAESIGREPWTGTTVGGIKIPLGQTGARKVQYLELGRGLTHHALIAGRPGSGKSNLMHVIIAGATRIYPPSELQFYLVDFKKGVEFQPYADALLPHARVIAVDSEREFGISVLRGLVNEMHARNELFSRSGVQDISRYRTQNPNVPMHRILLLVDEFQELFSPDDGLARDAALLLDQIVRMGRSAGIHALLGSQTLGGILVPPSTLNLMTVRIALQCSEADSHLILADDNPGARLLGRPGEGVYNSANGLMEGNSFFQISMFTEVDREEVLQDVVRLSSQSMSEAGDPSAFRPIVFKGYEPALLNQCAPLLAALENASATGGKSRAWLGEPIAIAPPTEVEFVRAGGSNLLVVNRDEAEGVGVVVASILGLGTQMALGTVKFKIIDLTLAESDCQKAVEWISEALTDEAEIYGRRDIPELLEQLSEEVKRRQDLPKPPQDSIFVIILGIHRARDLRLDDDFDRDRSPVDAFSRLLKLGPDVGIHAIVWVDGMTALERAVDPRLLREFGFRCSGPLDARGSDTLFDTDVATRLGARPHRMVISDESRVGVLQTFRPYAIPTREWIEAYRARLRQ